MSSETTIDEVMQFLQENVATKKDIENLRDELREELVSKADLKSFRMDFELFRSKADTHFESIFRELEDIKKHLEQAEQAV